MCLQCTTGEAGGKRRTGVSSAIRQGQRLLVRGSDSEVVSI
jgi:hypothetical protein